MEKDGEGDTVLRDIKDYVISFCLVLCATLLYKVI